MLLILAPHCNRSRRKSDLRRVGSLGEASGASTVKSELSLQFMRGKPGLYALGKQAPAELQIRELLRDAAELTGEPLLATMPAQSWGEALDAVVSRWKHDRKLILALDEFHWMAAASPVTWMGIPRRHSRAVPQPLHCP